MNEFCGRLQNIIEMNVSNAKKEILSYTIEALNDSLLIERKNSELKEKIKNFEQTLTTTQMDFDLCRSKMDELNKKKLLIQEKRQNIADMQRNIIKMLDIDNSIITDLSNNPSDYVGIPPVLMFVLETLYSATESQLSSKRIKIPISQILEISDSINEMYSKLVDSKIIDETEEETQQRNECIAQNQQFFMNELLNSIDKNDSETETVDDDDKDKNNSDENPNNNEIQ